MVSSFSPEGQKMNNKIRMTITLSVCIALLMTGTSTAQLESRVTLSLSGIIQQEPIVTYSYIMSVLNSIYQMADGTSGQIIFQSTNSSMVFGNVVGNCSVGSRINVLSGVYMVDESWIMLNINDIIVDFENGAKLVAGVGLDSPVLILKNSNNVLINGITIDGNAANQASTGYNWATENVPDGIFIDGSNNKVKNAVIYNCRCMGFDIWTVGSRGNIFNNGVEDSLVYDCGWNGIEIGSPFDLNCYAINNEVYGCGDVGIGNGGVNTIITGNYVHDVAIFIGGFGGLGAGSLWGISVEDGGNAIITQNTIQNCGVGIYTNRNNCTILDNTVINCSLGIELARCGYNTVKGNHITSSLNVGGYIYNSYFNIWTENSVTQCGGTLSSSGISLEGNSNNNTISLNMVYDNIGKGIDTTSSGVGNYFCQNQVFDTRTAGARTQTYGIRFAEGAKGNFVTGNNVYNCVASQIYDPNVPESTMINNTGYNPVGYIPSPISGSTAYIVDSGSNSTWISGMIYMNSGSPKELYISTGTISAVILNEVTLFTMTNCTLTLQPGDTLSLTFSVAPTIQVIGQ
jgi:parallel beta-helix repeat protein